MAVALPRDAPFPQQPEHESQSITERAGSVLHPRHGTAGTGHPQFQRPREQSGRLCPPAPQLRELSLLQENPESLAVIASKGNLTAASRARLTQLFLDTAQALCFQMNTQS